MKSVNLASVVIANNNLPIEQRDKLFNVWGISPKQKELVNDNSKASHVLG